MDSLAGASARDDAVQNGNVQQQQQQQQQSPDQVESRAGTSEAKQGDVALALGGNASLLSEKASKDMSGVHGKCVLITSTCCLGQQRHRKQHLYARLDKPSFLVLSYRYMRQRRNAPWWRSCWSWTRRICSPSGLRLVSALASSNTAA